VGRWLGLALTMWNTPPIMWNAYPVPVVARAVPVAWLGLVLVVAKWSVCVVNDTDSPRGYQLGAELGCDVRHKKTFQMSLTPWQAVPYGQSMGNNARNR
jgi:hypothetical protein